MQEQGRLAGVFSNALVRQRSGVWHQSNLPRPLDGQRHLSLMAGAVAGNSPGDDLSPFRDEIFQELWVFVVDRQS
jgi:hypothetical protein